MELDQFLGQGKAESGSFMQPFETAIDLRERLEGGLDLGGGHADAGVADLEPGCVVASQDLHRQAAAFGCEFDAVRQEMTCDLAQRVSVDALADAALAWHGRIDTLVCNAGIQGPAGPLAEATDQEWDAVMTVNLRSMAWLTTRLIPSMAARGGGSVILMSSIAGLRGNKAIGLYSLSKAAVAALARNLAVEWGPQGVRVNAISPGLIRTPLAEGMLADAALMQRRLSLTPLRRVGEPHEVAGAAVLLASRAGGFITGHNLVIDGGTTIGDGN